MNKDFSHHRWQTNRIGFHESRPNPLLVEHFPALEVPDGGRVFVPLCGKTRDIGWLLAYAALLTAGLRRTYRSRTPITRGTSS